jgi:hypothetical protein
MAKKISLRKIIYLKIHIRDAINLFKNTPWCWGWEWYKGKPFFTIGFNWYDGYHFAFHLWKLWINCSDFCKEDEENE